MRSLAHSILTDRGATPTRTAYLMHGIMGSGRNWRSFARRLTSARPAWRFVLVDLRCHGGSVGFAPPHDLDACAEDLARLAAELGAPPDVVGGHSFGGKVALTYARRYGRPPQTWVLDASPGRIDVSFDDPRTHEVVKVIASLEQLPTPLPSREALADRMRELGYTPGLIAWLSTNLMRGDGGYVWRFDLGGIRQLMESYFASDCWDVIEDPQAAAGREIGVVQGTLSDVWGHRAVARLETLAGAGLVRIGRVVAGHWLHAEAPDALLELLVSWLDDVEAAR